MTIYSGFTHEKLWFSIVMLVYTEVNRQMNHPQVTIPLVLIINQRHFGSLLLGFHGFPTFTSPMFLLFMVVISGLIQRQFAKGIHDLDHCSCNFGKPHMQYTKHETRNSALKHTCKYIYIYTYLKREKTNFFMANLINISISSTSTYMANKHANCINQNNSPVYLVCIIYIYLCVYPIIYDSRKSKNPIGHPSIYKFLCINHRNINI